MVDIQKYACGAEAFGKGEQREQFGQKTCRIGRRGVIAAGQALIMSEGQTASS